MQRFRAGAPILDVSLCWRKLTPDLPASAVYAVFSAHKLSSDEFGRAAPAVLEDADLAVRLGARVYRHADAQAFLTAAVVFGIEDATRHAALLPGEFYYIAAPKVCALHADPSSSHSSGFSACQQQVSLRCPRLPASERELSGRARAQAKRRRGWLTSIFWGSGDAADAPREMAAAAADGGDADGEATVGGSSRGGSSSDEVTPEVTPRNDAVAPPAETARENGRPNTKRRCATLATGTLTRTLFGTRQSSAGHAVTFAAARSQTHSVLRRVKVQSTHATPAQLAAMAEHLQTGQNLVEFEANGQRVHAFLYLFDWNIRLVVSDIDGTITKSDVLGHVLPRFGKDWTHEGITRLFANVAANGYQFLFLSSRSIAQSEETRAYLVSLKHQSFAMPAGARPLPP